MVRGFQGSRYGYLLAIVLSSFLTTVYHLFRTDWKIISLEEPIQPNRITEFEREILSYTQFHNEVTSYRKLDGKFVLCRLNNGYGNALQQLVSCLLYGILSKRAATIGIREQMESSWGLARHFGEFFPNPPVNLTHSLDSLIGGKEIPFLNWHRFFSCENFATYYAGHRIVTFSGYGMFDYPGAFMRNNPNNRIEVPSNFYQLIFRHLLPLGPKYQKEIDSFKANYFSEFNVGVQVRRQSINPVPFIPLDVYFQAADLLAMEQPHLRNKLVLFVASLDIKEIEEAKKIYGSNRVVYYQNMTMDQHEIDWMTFWLLGECDEVITTEFSSYGTNAAARSGKIPIVCTHNRYCFRRLTPQPCAMHPWPLEPLCSDTERSFVKYPDIELHCGFENEYARNCVEHGCPDHHNSWRNWPHKVPKYPPLKCNITI